MAILTNKQFNIETDTFTVSPISGPVRVLEERSKPGFWTGMLEFTLPNKETGECNVNSIGEGELCKYFGPEVSGVCVVTQDIEILSGGGASSPVTIRQIQLTGTQS